MSPRVLIVEDDPGQLRALARLVSAQREDLTVVTAADGLSAIEVLQEAPVDFLLTDLQMPGLNGFELLAWVASHQPHTPLCTMTAYPDAVAMDRLRELGVVQCFTKPIDVSRLLECLNVVGSSAAGGQLRNIGLPSFLQLLEMERKSCTLEVRNGAQLGMLHLRDGQVVHAQAQGLVGEPAAFVIIRWDAPEIRILGTQPLDAQSVRQPIGFLLMEALRRADEENSGIHDLDDSLDSDVRWSVPAAGLTSWEPGEVEVPSTPASMPVSAPANAVAVTVGEGALPSHVRAAAVVSAGEGQSLVQWGANQAGTELFRVAALLFEPSVHELVLTGPERWIVARALDADSRRIVALMYDVRAGTLLAARKALDELAERTRGLELRTGCSA